MLSLNAVLKANVVHSLAVVCSLNHVKAVANMVKDEATGEMKIESMMENRLTGTALSSSLD
jgi:hypothetical protein